MNTLPVHVAHYMWTIRTVVRGPNSTDLESPWRALSVHWKVTTLFWLMGLSRKLTDKYEKWRHVCSLTSHQTPSISENFSLTFDRTCDPNVVQKMGDMCWWWDIPNHTLWVLCRMFFDADPCWRCIHSMEHRDHMWYMMSSFWNFTFHIHIDIFTFFRASPWAKERRSDQFQLTFIPLY
jgi:hypothetical protein